MTTPRHVLAHLLVKSAADSAPGFERGLPGRFSDIDPVSDTRFSIKDPESVAALNRYMPQRSSPLPLSQGERDLVSTVNQGGTARYFVPGQKSYSGNGQTYTGEGITSQDGSAYRPYDWRANRDNLQGLAARSTGGRLPELTPSFNTIHAGDTIPYLGASALSHALAPSLAPIVDATMKPKPYLSQLYPESMDQMVLPK